MLFHCVGLMPSILSVRLDPATSAALGAAAAWAETSVSGFARAAIIKALPDAASLPPAAPSPRRRPLVVSEADIAAVARLMSAVSRFNGAMVQFSKGLRETGYVPEHEAMESAIRDIRDLKTEGVHLFRKLLTTEVSS